MKTVNILFESIIQPITHHIGNVLFIDIDMGGVKDGKKRWLDFILGCCGLGYALQLGLLASAEICQRGGKGMKQKEYDKLTNKQKRLFHLANRNPIRTFYGFIADLLSRKNKEER